MKSIFNDWFEFLFQFKRNTRNCDSTYRSGNEQTNPEGKVVVKLKKPRPIGFRYCENI